MSKMTTTTDDAWSYYRLKARMQEVIADETDTRLDRCTVREMVMDQIIDDKSNEQEVKELIELLHDLSGNPILDMTLREYTVSRLRRMTAN